MSTKDRGFASMEKTRQREIASRGGRAAHEKGTAHEWTSEEAREAGRKGGINSWRAKMGRKAQAQAQVPTTSAATNLPPSETAAA